MQRQAHCLGIYHVDYIAITWISHMLGYWVILIWLECNSLSSSSANISPLFVMHLPSPSACSWAGTQGVTPLFFSFHLLYFSFIFSFLFFVFSFFKLIWYFQISKHCKFWKTCLRNHKMFVNSKMVLEIINISQF